MTLDHADLQRVWHMMSPYLRKLYGEACLLDTGGVLIEVQEPDDRDGYVCQADHHWRGPRIALSHGNDPCWYEDLDRGRGAEFATLQEAWDTLHHAE